MATTTLATAMTDVTEENEKILRGLEERRRRADVEPHTSGCTAQLVPFAWEQLGDCDLCHGDVQHIAISVNGPVRQPCKAWLPYATEDTSRTTPGSILTGSSNF